MIKWQRVTGEWLLLRFLHYHSTTWSIVVLSIPTPANQLSGIYNSINHMAPGKTMDCYMAALAYLLSTFNRAYSLDYFSLSLADNLDS